MTEPYTPTGMRQLELIWATDGPAFVLADCDDTGAMRHAMKLPKSVAPTLVQMLQDAIAGEAAPSRLLLSSEDQERLRQGEALELGDGYFIRWGTEP